MDTELIALYRKLCGADPAAVQLLAGEGSARKYYRLTGRRGDTLIGTVGSSAEENRSYFAICRHFAAQGLPVPRLLITSDDGMRYLQSDLGDTTLYALLAPARESGCYTGEQRALLRRTLSLLADVQFLGARGFDFAQCYPAPAFDRRLVEWDLNYFKYCFLKAVGIEFNENRLQDELDRLADEMLAAPCDTFMYRDFQSRNIMVQGGEPWLIDFQGGRRGPLYYDVASFVGQSRAAYPPRLVDEMVTAYLESLARYRAVDPDEFRDGLRRFMLFRSMQTLGAYGFRGLYERKKRFIESIPPSLARLSGLLASGFDDLPYLRDLLLGAAALPRFAPPAPGPKFLTVEVASFSYRRGIPDDDSGNGGGFVFDCRGIENPGRYEPYKNLTGFDSEVIQFLEQEGSILRYLQNAYGMVDAAVEKYLRRGFTHLSVCFGCTGGQHRSVYCAESMARHLSATFTGLKIHVTHRERNREYWIDRL